jgi:hypothetical protein
MKAVRKFVFDVADSVAAILPQRGVTTAANGTPRGWTYGVVIWLVVVFLLIVVTVVLTQVFKPPWGIPLSVALWAFAIGGLVDFLVPSKAVTAIAGGLVGLGADDKIGTAGSILTKVADMVTEVSKVLGTIVTTETPDQIKVLVWLFGSVLFVTSLYGFFKN